MLYIESEQTEKEIVSVIVPLYNHELYIEECLDSVLKQDLPNIELLLIDDGSTDNGYEKAKTWKERNEGNLLRIEIERQTNVGITRTFDRLIKKSTGKFITILASDDVLLPNSISQRLRYFKNRKTKAVFGDAIPIDTDGNALGESAIGELGNSSSRSALSDYRTLPWELIFRWNVYGSVLLCRREALVNPDGTSTLDLSIYSEDMQLYYKLASNNSLVFLDSPVAKYRIHDSNTSRTIENIKTIHKNIYQSRMRSLKDMPLPRRIIVLLQAITYHRWDVGYKKLIYLPMVVIAYSMLKISCVIYDVVRKSILGQSAL